MIPRSAGRAALLHGEELDLVEQVVSCEVKCTADLTEREVEVAWRLLAGGYLVVLPSDEEWTGWPRLTITPKALLALPVEHGEFDCYVCGADAGEHYCSDHRTDGRDLRFGDVALVLCDACADRGAAMSDEEALAFYRAGVRWKSFSWQRPAEPSALADACLQAGFDVAEGAARRTLATSGEARLTKEWRRRLIEVCAPSGSRPWTAALAIFAERFERDGLVLVVERPDGTRPRVLTSEGYDAAGGCKECKPADDAVNHVQGHVFVGWGHGWQPCHACKGSGFDPEIGVVDHEGAT